MNLSAHVSNLEAAIRQIDRDLPKASTLDKSKLIQSRAYVRGMRDVLRVLTGDTDVVPAVVASCPSSFLVQQTVTSLENARRETFRSIAQKEIESTSAGIHRINAISRCPV